MAGGQALDLTLPTGGASVSFFVAGVFGRPSTDPGDVSIEARQGTTLVATGSTADEGAPSAVEGQGQEGGEGQAPPPGGDQGAVAEQTRLEGYDIGWRTADQPGPQVELHVAPGATIELVNAGSAEHNFHAEDLGIDEDMAVGYSGEITIPADAAPGTYDFVCNVPGHAAAGMVGTLVIG